MKRIIYFTFIIFLITGYVANAFPKIDLREIVILPYELEITEKIKLTIRETGVMELNDKTFVYRKDDYMFFWEEGVMVRIYSSENLCGIDIMEQTWSGGIIGYTHILNLETQEEIPYERYEYFRFWGFFSFENIFIMTSAEKAYAFNDSTRELLWTQTYMQRDGNSIIKEEDYLIKKGKNN